MSGVKRAVRVSERIRGELMNMLHRGEIRDPRVEGLVITRLTVTDDLQLARIYVRTALVGPELAQTAGGQGAEGQKLIDSQADAQRKIEARVMKALEQASGYIRREIGRRVQLKYTPQLRFFWDAETDEAERVTHLLDELKAEPKG